MRTWRRRRPPKRRPPRRPATASCRNPRRCRGALRIQHRNGRRRLRRLSTRPLRHRLFNEATKRAKDNDPATMALLGLLYDNGQGVLRATSAPRRRSGRSRWRPPKADRDALFALAMLLFAFEGRAGDHDPAEEAPRLLGEFPRLRSRRRQLPISAFSISEVSNTPQDFNQAGELTPCRRQCRAILTVRAPPPMYTLGRGAYPRDPKQATLLLCRKPRSSALSMP